MAENTTYPGLSSALEDYLETIFVLVRDNKFARVKDIAKARGVRSASVSPAMRRLAELGLIKYVQREYIDLTDEGEAEARKIYARHRVLSRFFEEILGVPAQAALEDACSMEHSLSDVSMDHLVRFFEFLEACPEGEGIIGRFHNCSLVNDDVEECEIVCPAKKKLSKKKNKTTLFELTQGQKGRVRRIEGTGSFRQSILDCGIMPNLVLEVDRVSPDGKSISVNFQGTQISLNRKEAESIVVITV
jgi:DtxR family Mn-dependent transcriptional regulator